MYVLGDSFSNSPGHPVYYLCFVCAFCTDHNFVSRTAFRWFQWFDFARQPRIGQIRRTSSLLDRGDCDQLGGIPSRCQLGIHNAYLHTYMSRHLLTYIHVTTFTYIHTCHDIYLHTYMSRHLLTYIHTCHDITYIHTYNLGLICQRWEVGFLQEVFHQGVYLLTRYEVCIEHINFISNLIEKFKTLLYSGTKLHYRKSEPTIVCYRKLLALCFFKQNFKIRLCAQLN
jgi:hypothetical protein